MSVSTPGMQILADGVDISSSVAGLKVAMSLDGATATAELSCVSRPMDVNPPNGMGENNAVDVWAGWSGALHQIFLGYVDETAWAWPDLPAVTFPCRDRLAITRLPWGRADLGGGEDLLARVYEGQTDDAIVRNILEAYGLPNTIASIEGAGIVLGQAEPIVLPVGKPGWTVIAELDKLLGYATYTTRQGTIFRRKRFALPETAAATIQAAVKADGMIRLRRRRGIPEIVNQVRVEGLVIDELPIASEARTTHPDTAFWLPDPPGTITREIRSNLIDDQLIADALAEFWVHQLDRPREYYELELVGRPLLSPGDRLDVVCPGAEFAGSMLVSAVSHQFTNSGFTTSVRGYEVWPVDYPTG